MRNPQRQRLPGAVRPDQRADRDVPEPQVDGIEHKTAGPLQSSFTASYKWGMSKLKVTPILNAGEKAVRFCIEAEWNEVTGEDSAPLLVFRVPHSEKIGKYPFCGDSR